MAQQKPDNDTANAKNEPDRLCEGAQRPRQSQHQHQPQYHEDEIDIDLVDYIKIIYKRWKIIVVIVFISMLVSGIFSLMKPKMYEAQATFFPLNAQSNIETGGIVIKPSLDIKDLIISILNSRKMADRIIEQLKLKDTWNQNLSAHTRKSLDKATKISLDKNGIIKLSVHTTSPELSAKIANSYVDNLDYFNRELNIGANTNIVQVIDRAAIPEERMPRGTVKKIFLNGIVSFMFAIFLAFFIEFIKKSNLKSRLKEN